MLYLPVHKIILSLVRYFIVCAVFVRHSSERKGGSAKTTSNEHSVIESGKSRGLLQSQNTKSSPKTSNLLSNSNILASHPAGLISKSFLNKVGAQRQAILGLKRTEKYRLTNISFSTIILSYHSVSTHMPMQEP